MHGNISKRNIESTSSNDYSGVSSVFSDYTENSRSSFKSTNTSKCSNIRNDSNGKNNLKDNDTTKIQLETKGRTTKIAIERNNLIMKETKAIGRNGSNVKDSVEENDGSESELRTEIENVSANTDKIVAAKNDDNTIESNKGFGNYNTSSEHGMKVHAVNEFICNSRQGNINSVKPVLSAPAAIGCKKVKLSLSEEYQDTFKLIGEVFTKISEEYQNIKKSVKMSSRLNVDTMKQEKEKAELGCDIIYDSRSNHDTSDPIEDNLQEPVTSDNIVDTSSEWKSMFDACGSCALFDFESADVEESGKDIKSRRMKSLDKIKERL
eukprot:CAMPEP_0194272634 /NCGR_PEP_ID=MMETSP0169-20130528/6145_1 /TAXON_ID=218684 /ORGANISM="Corethron pennatum, Strain L29A3" /LENGTH=321 /DNA_ID=CAMNT_0039015343 /DNA_START=2054 /DNA_END=3019 /DNA_ORIENTATION=+